MADAGEDVDSLHAFPFVCAKKTFDFRRRAVKRDGVESSRARSVADAFRNEGECTSCLPAVGAGVEENLSEQFDSKPVHGRDVWEYDCDETLIRVRPAYKVSGC